MITKWKRNKNLEMANFWQYLTVQIVLTERNTSLIIVFLQLLKIMAKKAWNFRKWDKGKVISSNFQERFNWERVWKDKNENNAFCLPFIDFFTQSSQYQIWKANIYSILANGNWTWTASVEFSTRISKFYPHWFWTQIS